MRSFMVLILTLTQYVNVATIKIFQLLFTESMQLKLHIFYNQRVKMAKIAEKLKLLRVLEDVKGHLNF